MKGVNAYINFDESGDIKLNGNESYFPKEKEKLRKVAAIIENVELNRYPENDALKLREAYGAYAKVDKDSIIAGNGSDEMISLLMGAYLGSGKKVLVLEPDFSMYDFYGSLYGANIIKFNCNKDGSFSMKDFINKGKEEVVDLIIFSNPNNPTGYSPSREEIISLLEEFKETKVVIDEAYYEFNGESVIDIINDYSNLFVTRTLSKAWGLAALRVGFLIGNKKVVSQLRSHKVPYNISSLSQLIAIEFLKDKDLVASQVKEIIEQRKFLISELKNIEEKSALQIEFYNSKGNFVYGRSNHKDILITALKSKGIVIRDFSSNDSFRITVGSYIQNLNVINAIKEAFIYE